jgi:hypothetical protein
MVKYRERGVLDKTFLYATEYRSVKSSFKLQGGNMSYRETKSGRFYAHGYKNPPSSKQLYDVGKHTESGSEVIETVVGLKQARALLKQLEGEL